MRKKLLVELIPKTSWYQNVRSKFTPEMWDLIRRKIYRRDNYFCTICGGKGKQHPVECHEIFEYTTERNQSIQRLVGLESLCPDCHLLGRHPGLANVKGRGDEVVPYLMKVNGWSQKKCQEHLEKSWHTWHQRNEIDWEVDLSWANSLSDINHQLI